ncbi:hypothetical protein L1887_28411 [Cichorium endivia]|nr:hypothetical protein L1887_28411 [Cichorium endivia]
MSVLNVIRERTHDEEDEDDGCDDDGDGDKKKKKGMVVDEEEIGRSMLKLGGELGLLSILKSIRLSVIGEDGVEIDCAFLYRIPSLWIYCGFLKETDMMKSRLAIGNGSAASTTINSTTTRQIFTLLLPYFPSIGALFSWDSLHATKDRTKEYIKAY